MIKKTYKTNQIPQFVILLAALTFAWHASGRDTSHPGALGRFSVAHEHGTSWCLGYLYIYADSISYEVTWPASEKSHSFVLKRSDLQSVSRWLRSGKSLKAAEVRSAKASYHFWWLANEQDVINGKPHQDNPPDLFEPDDMIADILDPAKLTKEPASSLASSGASANSQLAQIPDSPLAGNVQAGNAPAKPHGLRFAVIHAHSVYHCVGYLHVSEDRVRYEVIQPESDKRHEFSISKSEIIAVNQWILVGTPKNAVEMKTARGTYHFWVLPKGSDLVNTPYKQWTQSNLASSGSLLKALQGEIELKE